MYNINSSVASSSMASSIVDDAEEEARVLRASKKGNSGTPHQQKEELRMHQLQQDKRQQSSGGDSRRKGKEVAFESEAHDLLKQIASMEGRLARLKKEQQAFESTKKNEVTPSSPPAAKPRNKAPSKALLPATSSPPDYEVSSLHSSTSSPQKAREQDGSRQKTVARAGPGRQPTTKRPSSRGEPGGRGRTFDPQRLGMHISRVRSPAQLSPPSLVPTRYVHSGSPMVASRVRSLSLMVRQLDRNSHQQETLMYRQRQLVTAVNDSLLALHNELSLRRFVDPRTMGDYHGRPMSHHGEW